MMKIWWDLNRMRLKVRLGVIVTGRVHADLYEQMFPINRALVEVKVGTGVNYNLFVMEMNR